MQSKPLQSIKHIRNMLRAGVILLCLIASGVLLTQPVARNKAFTQALRAVSRNPRDYDQGMTLLRPILAEDCRINWQIVSLAFHSAEQPDVEANLGNMLECSPTSVAWLFMMAPQREDLASRAAQLYPQDPNAWFWLGDLVSTSGDLIMAEKYYSESVRLDPTNALASCRLGRIYDQQGQLKAAIDSFWQCCQNGDPGSNGCYGAGRVAEKLDDIPAAIRYYSRSRWLPALQRAEDLETSR